MNTYLLTLILAPFFVFATSQALTALGVLTKTPIAEYYGRSLASFLALFLCATYGTFASLALNIAGYGGLGQWTTARAFKWSMWVFTGVWFDLEFEEEKDWLSTTRPAVFVGNHQTELDVAMLGHVFPRYCSVTAKSSLKWVPFLGWFMALSKTVFIQRSSRSQALAAFSAAALQMHSTGQSVYIFPEGTRSYYSQPDLLPFKKGAFHLAIQAQVPIVPIVAGNYSNVLDMKRKVFRAGRIPVRVLKPVETRGKTKEDVDALLEVVRGRMLEALKDVTETARERGVAPGKMEWQKRVNGGAKTTGVDVGMDAAS